VFLFATPKTFVRDHYITSNLSVADNYTAGSMNVAVEMDNRDAVAAEKKVEVALIAPDGALVAKKDVVFEFAAGESMKNADVLFEGLTGLQLWSAEAPNLYTVEVVQKDAAGNVPAVYRGSAATNGGNLYLKCTANIEAAHIAKGTAGTLGADIYVASHADTAVTLGADVKGNIALGVDKKLFASADIYGGAINKITCKAADATFYLDGSYNNCGTMVKDETIYLTVAAVITPDGTMQWHTSNEDAIAACGEGAYVKLFTDKALVLTKDLVVDLNGNTVAVSGHINIHTCMSA
jgi:hypothetical protein